MVPNPRKRTVIGVDLDNILARTDEKIRELIRAKWSIDSSQSEIVSWNYHENLPITAEQERELWAEFHSKHLLDVRVVEGARAGMRALQRIAPLWVMTQRPPYAQCDTVEWLRRNGIVYDDVLFIPDKSQLASQLRVLIDDNGTTALSVASKGTEVLLFDYPWNRFVPETPQITRVRSWREILQLVNPPMTELAMQLA